VLRQARELGVVQLGFSGGEPLVRDDAEMIVAEAHHLGYYINLLTSGVVSPRSASRRSRKAAWIRSSCRFRIQSPSTTPGRLSTAIGCCLAANS
jgi:hypothetical protein